jgi:hypothetical protein
MISVPAKPDMDPMLIGALGSIKIYTRSGTAGVSFASGDDKWRRGIIEINIDIAPYQANNVVQGKGVEARGFAFPTSIETNGHDYAGWAVDKTVTGKPKGAAGSVIIPEVEVAVKGEHAQINAIGWQVIFETSTAP